MKLLSTSNSIALFVVRIALGIVFLPHGLQKTTQLFGGHGLSASIQMFTQGMHVPYVFALLAIAAESLGALGLIFGFLTRIAALGICCNMIVAIVMVHAGNGFFMNWMGNQKGEGFEYHLLAIGMALALIIAGGGRWSVDRAICEKVVAAK